ncbi:hypothetical protein TNCV_422431 [Trichonephila clavipes]|nr:hypothetical protein TNCV_422431 [Trichonephila clavipes]
MEDEKTRRLFLNVSSGLLSPLSWGGAGHSYLSNSTRHSTRSCSAVVFLMAIGCRRDWLWIRTCGWRVTGSSPGATEDPPRRESGFTYKIKWPVANSPRVAPECDVNVTPGMVEISGA